ncbi:MAG: hypothetical protein COX78_03135, partial [Candidatus Levybacteria bacterium CG_4_10_14_0_2_um_filter_35_8]
RTELPVNDFKNTNYYVYSCLNCSINTPKVNLLAQKFKYKEFASSPGKVFIFFLKQKAENSNLKVKKDAPEIVEIKNVKIDRQSYLRKTYNYLLNLLQAPQI